MPPSKHNQPAGEAWNQTACVVSCKQCPAIQREQPAPTATCQQADFARINQTKHPTTPYMWLRVKQVDTRALHSTCAPSSSPQPRINKTCDLGLAPILSHFLMREGMEICHLPNDFRSYGTLILIFTTPHLPYFAGGEREPDRRGKVWSILRASRYKRVPFYDHSHYMLRADQRMTGASKRTGIGGCATQRSWGCATAIGVRCATSITLPVRLRDTHRSRLTHLLWVIGETKPKKTKTQIKQQPSVVISLRDTSLRIPIHPYCGTAVREKQRKKLSRY